MSMFNSRKFSGGYTPGPPLKGEGLCHGCWGWTPLPFLRSNFAEFFGFRNRIRGLSCSVVCLIVSLAVLVEHQLVTDGHRPIASCGKNLLDKRITLSKLKVIE